jgi:hypothetical protein
MDDDSVCVGVRKRQIFRILKIDVIVEVRKRVMMGHGRPEVRVSYL